MTKEEEKELRKYEAYQKLLSLNAQMKVLSNRMYEIFMKKRKQRSSYRYWYDSLYYENAECREHDGYVDHGYRVSWKLRQTDIVAYVKQLKKEQAKPSCEHAGKSFYLRELPPFIMPFMRKRDRRKLKQISKI